MVIKSVVAGSSVAFRSPVVERFHVYPYMKTLESFKIKGEQCC